MNTKVMFCLVGEQPVSNYLPVRYISPKKVVLLYSAFTRQHAMRLSLLLKTHGIEIKEVQIEPYCIDIAIDQIKKVIQEETFSNNNTNDDFCFNLTGGTKPMCLAAYHLCVNDNIPYWYLQSEGGRSLLHVYTMQEGQWCRNNIGIDGIITLDEYLRLHVGQYKTLDMKHTFEKVVYQTLKETMDEIICNVSLSPSLEIDLVFRFGNQFGIAEIKTGKSAISKNGIDQLNAAAGREHLGTYIKKFFIIDRSYPENNMLLAQERKIHVVELMNSTVETLTVDDQEKLIKIVLDQMKK